jgi:trigger factor
MSVVVSVADVGPSRKELKIEVPAPAVEAEFERVSQEYGKKARVPGFRKGKVPAAMVRRHFSQEIEAEVLERLVPRYWHQAQAETALDPLASPQVKDVHLHPGAALHFTAVVEVRPQIELRNTADFNLPEMDVRPSEEEVNRTLDDLRASVAEWNVVSRPAARGDGVQGEIREAALILAPGQSEGAPQQVAFVIGDPNVWEELALAATGLAPGQAASFEHRHQENGAEGESAAVKRYRLTVNEVREQKLPALDDDFAKKIGKFESAAALRADVESRIASAKRLERRRRREQAVVDQLRERHPLELPQGVVEHEQEHLLREYAEELAQRGVDLEKTEIEWPKLGEEMKPAAERRVHARLLLDAVAERDGVTVDEDEFERTLVAIGRAEGKSGGEVRQALDQNGRLQSLRSQLRREKALSKLAGE